MLLKFNPFEQPTDPDTRPFENLGYPFSKDTSKEAQDLCFNFAYATDWDDLLREWKKDRTLTEQQIRIVYKALYQPKCSSKSIHHLSRILFYCAIVQSPSMDRSKAGFEKQIGILVRNIGTFSRKYQMKFTQLHMQALRNESANN